MNVQRRSVRVNVQTGPRRIRVHPGKLLALFNVVTVVTSVAYLSGVSGWIPNRKITCRSFELKRKVYERSLFGEAGGQSDDDKAQRSSKHKAISALSQPGRSNTSTNSKPRKQKRGLAKGSLSPKNTANRHKKGKHTRGSSPAKDSTGGRSSAKGISKTSKNGNQSKGYRGRHSRMEQSPKKSSKNRSSVPPPTQSDTYASLLPPPLARTDANPDGVEGQAKGDSISNGETSTSLSSWEQFLGVSASDGASQGGQMGDDEQTVARDRISSPLSKNSEDDNSNISDDNRLPSIQDLFPPDLSPSTANQQTRSQHQESQPRNAPDEDKTVNRRDHPPPFLEGVLPVSDLFYRSSQAEDDDEDHDDEELPFSAEQSDAVTSDENQILIRRNLAKAAPSFQRKSKKISKRQKKKQADIAASKTKAAASPEEYRGRKMVRRGMDMLVGGVPINADPPQRAIQLHFDGKSTDWASIVTVNSEDFGPLLHVNSAPLVPKAGRGSFCEFFCRSAIKWDICPDDLNSIVKAGRKPAPQHISKSQRNGSEKATNVVEIENNSSSKKKDRGAGKRTKSNRDRKLASVQMQIDWEIGVSPEELKAGELSGDTDFKIFRSVIVRALNSLFARIYAVDASGKNDIDLVELALKSTEDSCTSATIKFKLCLEPSDSSRKTIQRVSSEFKKGFKGDAFQLVLAASAKQDKLWPDDLRNRFVEECLFQKDDFEEESRPVLLLEEKKLLLTTKSTEKKTLLLGEDLKKPDGKQKATSDSFAEAGYYDFTTGKSRTSPYGGEIGLQLVDAVTERAKHRQPRVIAIGDVHGCIDELQDLLRQCDYRPGDLVVFLGDLVCKGPDSISVVQMAREIGAIGVRGNHDFEIVRWHQAILSGVDPPVFGSEHYHIASCLGRDDMEWMHSLPWYIASQDLGALFVHAGFVSGIRLAKQNPRLMMNMRSILPDGTVTSKFFNNWPWARLWDGPLTVLFGHDADRGLQQYEHAIGLDTGCVYGGRLTACILPEKRLVSVSARREYFKYRRKHYD